MINFKNEFLKELISIKEAELEQLKKGQADRLEEANQSDSDKQNRFESPQEKEMDEVEQYARTLDELNKDLNALKKIQDEKIEAGIAFGSLVKTDKGSFLVASPFLKRDFQGKNVTGISTDSPLFKKMEGLKAEDEFDLNDNHYQVLEIS